MNRSKDTKWPFLIMVLIQATACASLGPKPEPASLALGRDVHFFGEEAAPVLVPAGSYRVEDAGDATLRLTSTTGSEVFVLETVSDRAEGELAEGPAFRSSSLGDDEHVLSLRVPDGVLLEAYGNYSGVMPRTGRRKLVARRRFDATSMQAAAIGPSPGEPRTFSVGGFFGKHEDYGNFGSYVSNLTFRTSATASPMSVKGYLTLSLPDGAVVRALQLWYRDTDPYKDVKAVLVRTHLDRVNSQTMATVTSTGSGGFGSSMNKSISYATVDNGSHGYLLEIYLPRHYTAGGVQMQSWVFGVTLFVDEP